MAPSSQQALTLAQIVPVTEAEGPGRRFAIWLQGCPLRCPGCCNPEMLPFEGGQAYSVETLLRHIEAAKAEGVEGITMLGGEPFAHAEGASALALAVRRQNLSVMIFSGFALEELRALPDPFSSDLLRNTDILVDGPYLRERPEKERRWIGSSNQRVHFLSDRYQADDSCWTMPNTLEIRLTDGELCVNGFPAPRVAISHRSARL